MNTTGRAPLTTSTHEAVDCSTSVAEQLIRQAIDLGVYGCYPEMVDISSARAYLNGGGRALSPNRVASVLSDLGYVKYPALSRSEGKLSTSSGRIRLYVKQGSEAYFLKTPDEIISYWEALNKRHPRTKDFVPLIISFPRRAGGH